MVEELSATRRQLSASQRAAAEAKEDATESNARRREAERRLRELEESVGLEPGAALGLGGGEGRVGGASLLDVERRASTELLGVTLKEKQAQVGF